MRNRTSAALVIGVIGACSANGVAPRGSLRSAVLHYSAASAQGAPLLAGSLRLEAHDDSTVTGTWAIDWVVGADTTAPVGPQVGSGTLSGQLYGDGSLALNLNPLYADNNVVLYSEVTTTGLSGQWTWSGFAGPLASGRFSAPYAAP
jgi:hypothetical protein